MRVLVTGATGFLGGHLLDVLRGEGARVAALVRSSEVAERLRAEGIEVFVGALGDTGILRAALRSPTDAVFHTAADTSPWRGHAARQTQTNVEGTRAVLAAAESAGVRRFIHTSSVSAYGQQDGVLDEDTPRLGAQSWINYERTKAVAEALVAEAGDRGRIETVILNPAHILGPGDRHNWARLFLLIDQDKLPGAPPGSGAFADVRAVARAEVAHPLRAPRSQAEHSLSAVRHGHDRRAPDHVDRAVAVLADVVAAVRVVPVEQEAVQARVDRRARPGVERRELGRHREGSVDVARVDVVGAVRLLPSRRLHGAALHLDLVEL
ncbi:MAG: NAD-dependent epimerase/dehydratase family protein, partial [Xanthomonadales bacterium]|nr:NAD-dependent epimerase/dehydratase family protein [Xanthomonadales bacterium]